MKLVAAALMLFLFGPAGAPRDRIAVPTLDSLPSVRTAHAGADYATALREVRTLAEKGDGAAQYMLGYMYDRGQGTPRDPVHAMMWFVLAEQNGVPEASLAKAVVGSRMSRPQRALSRRLAQMWRPTNP